MEHESDLIHYRVLFDVLAPCGAAVNDRGVKATVFERGVTCPWCLRSSAYLAAAKDGMQSHNLQVINNADRPIEVSAQLESDRA